MSGWALARRAGPLRAAGAVLRFLSRWRPDVVVVAELDLWLVMLDRLRVRGIPLMMAHARMTDHRVAGRKRVGRISAMLRLMQDGLMRERLTSIGR
jgi:3-deoxy-D-manno-octulosonic-acid transferase